jgi:hypothetical protein
VTGKDREPALNMVDVSILAWALCASWRGT